MNNALDARRRQVVQEMLAIRSLCRGTLSEQFVERVLDGKATGEMRGPYFVLSRNVQGRTESSRVRRKDAERVRADLDRHAQFMALCEDFIRLTEQLGQLERDTVVDEAEKKSPNSRRRPRPR